MLLEMESSEAAKARQSAQKRCKRGQKEPKWRSYSGSQWTQGRFSGDDVLQRRPRGRIGDEAARIEPVLGDRDPQEA